MKIQKVHEQVEEGKARCAARARTRGLVLSEDLSKVDCGNCNRLREGAAQADKEQSTEETGRTFAELERGAPFPFEGAEYVKHDAQDAVCIQTGQTRRMPLDLRV